jgi:hypothetical protein
MDEQDLSDQTTAGSADGSQTSDKKRSKRGNARTRAEKATYEPHYNRPGPRRSSENRANAFNTLAWLVEGATGLVEELRHSDLGLSEEFWVHVYAMRREGLLAARAAIDSLLEKSEQEGQEAQEQSKRQARRGQVNIE